MRLSSFNFELPPKLIPKYPLDERDASRMMVVDRKSGTIKHSMFVDLPNYLNEHDVIVLNNAKVFPTLLKGRKEKTKAEVEVLLCRELNPEQHLWDTLINPARKIRISNRLCFGADELVAEIIDNTISGGRTIKFSFQGTSKELHAVLKRLGSIPLPEALGREMEELDKTRYQTIFATETGSIVAPAAGFHFTPYTLKHLAYRGVEAVYITAHISPNSISSIDVEDLNRYKIASEYFSIGSKAAQTLHLGLQEERNICAVGICTFKALEASYGSLFIARPISSWNDKFIFTPDSIKVCKTLLTNFHLPRSSAFVTLSTFAGKDLICHAYDVALREGYRFFVYGDVMLVL